MSHEFTAVLIFCLLPLAVWAWDYFTGQRSERVNASQDKTRLLDGSKLGVVPMALIRPVIGANISANVGRGR